MKKLLTRGYLLSIFIAVVVAGGVGYYFALWHWLFLPVAAICVMLTSVGNAFYQGMQRLMSLLLLLLVSALFLSALFFYQAMHDILLGAGIGMLANSLIFPRRPDSQFKTSILPVIFAYVAYLEALASHLPRIEYSALKNAQQSMRQRIICLPQWIFNPGFTFRLQKGYRFYFVKIEHMHDLIEAIDHFMHYPYAPTLVAEFYLPFCTYLQTLVTTLKAIASVMQGTTQQVPLADLHQALQELQQKMHSLVSENLEVIDLHPEHLALIELSYTLNDLARAAEKLTQALRAVPDELALQSLT